MRLWKDPRFERESWCVRLNHQKCRVLIDDANPFLSQLDQKGHLRDIAEDEPLHGFDPGHEFALIPKRERPAGRSGEEARPGQVERKAWKWGSYDRIVSLVRPMHGVADLEGSMGDDPVTRSEEIGKAVVLEDEKLILVQEVIVDLARVDRGEREPGAAGAPAATIGRCGPGSGDSGTMSIPMRSRHPSYDNTYYVSFDGVAPTRDHCGLFFLPTKPRLRRRPGQIGPQLPVFRGAPDSGVMT